MDEPHSTIIRAREALEAAVLALDQLSKTEALPFLARRPTPRERALAWLESSRRRARIMDGQLSEGAWTILMDLYVNQDVRPVSVSSACIASGHPVTTALRWIRGLIDLGLVTRQDDGRDGRRVYLALTSKGEEAVLAHLEN